ncbi:ATP-binding protein [Leptospira sp. WS92.C1]
MQISEYDFQIGTLLQTPIVILNRDERIDFCNLAFAKLVGSTPILLKSQDFREFFRFQNLTLSEECKNSKLQKSIFFKDRIQLFDGQEVLLGGSIAYFSENSGDYFLLEILEKTEDSIFQEKETEIATVISRIYHDLQEPIRNLSSFLKILSDKYSKELNPKGQDFLRICVQAANRLWERINGLLLLPRIEKEKNILKLLSLKKIIDESLLDIKEDLEKTGTQVFVEGEFPELIGNPVLLREVFLNLLNNSIQFRKKDQNSQIKIIYSNRSRFHEIQVQDNGIGVDLAEKKYFIGLFKKYHDIEEFNGPGTGLFFCKKIVELHGGFLEVKTQKAMGFSVTISFPREFKLKHL